MRILKIENCPSISGNSNLTYHVGCSDQGDIQFRLQANTASGYFSRDFIAMVHLEPMLNAEKITSGSFKPLFEGKSVNSSGFFLAVLLKEGLVQSTEGKRRSYVRCDPSAFIKAMQVLMESDVSLDADQPPTPKPGKKNKSKS